MPKKKQVEVKCPYCGVNNQTSVWNTINAQLNPDEKTALLNGDINVFTCPKCAKNVFVDKKLLYQDTENNFWTYYIPFEIVNTWDLSKVLTPGGRLKAAERYEATSGSDNKVEVHFVLDMGELVRYIKFRDAICESYKLRED